jgi:hypothetical protein
MDVGELARIIPGMADGRAGTPALPVKTCTVRYGRRRHEILLPLSPEAPRQKQCRNRLVVNCALPSSLQEFAINGEGLHPVGVAVGDIDGAV